MAMTQDQWYEKLKSFVPSWWFASGDTYTIAVFQAIAAVFRQLEEDSDDQFTATFLTKSVSPVLDLIGAERNILRIPGEPADFYTARMQQITSHTNKIDIAKFIDSLLLVPGVTILEAPADAPYCNRGSFCSDSSSFLLELRQNYFLVLVPRQTHVPYSFTSRLNFCSRQDFVGSLDVSADAYVTIIAAVNALKAFGVMWGLSEKTS